MARPPLDAQRGRWPLEHEHPQRHPGSLHRHRPEVAEAEPALHQAGGVLGEVGRPGHREGLHALGQADRVPKRGGIDAQILAHPANDRLPGVEPDTHVEVHTLRLAQPVGVGADGPGHVPGRMAGTTGVILLGEGGAEEGHDPVACELVDSAAEAAHSVGEDVHEAVDDLAHASTSRSSCSSIEPCTSANRTVKSLPSPSGSRAA